MQTKRQIIKLMKEQKLTVGKRTIKNGKYKIIKEHVRKADGPDIWDDDTVLIS